MTIVLLCVLSTLLLAGPFAASALGHPLDPLTNVILTASGIATFVLTAIVLIVTKLYQKTKASEAFVRTGAGGVKVIRDGGALIVPVIHELIRVSLQTLKLEVVRENQDALITQDKLRADIRAEFFVRVQPDRDSILQAARSLGDCMQDRAAVKAVVEDKLVSALRTAAASKTLEQLNSERDEFLSEVMKLVAEDLRSNGLVLETVTISKLDQTDEQFLKAENIFDAQGRRKIAEITQLNLTERNRLVREGEQARKEQDVLTKRQVLDFERQEAEAHARQQAEIQKIEADAAREAQEKRIAAERQVLLAGIAKTKDLELATRLQEQAIEVAEREKQQQIALAEKQRAAAEGELAAAEAERERARQTVETVRVTEEANRQKEKQVIDAQATAEQMYVAEQRKADADAYTRQKQADAQKAAADAEAEAIRKRAQAEAEAEQARAAGERARAMVPVDVRKAELAVEKDRIANVVKAELEAREKHGKVAQEFEIAKLRVEAEKEVRIATANAQASMFTKMQANLYGTTADVDKLMSSLLRGQSAATTLGGFFGTADENTLGITQGLIESARGIADAARDRLAGQERQGELEPDPALDAEPEVEVTEPFVELEEAELLAGE